MPPRTDRVVFSRALSPMELPERLAALIPRPGSNQILYDGVFAANAKWRPRIVPVPGRPPKTCSPSDVPDASFGPPNHSPPNHSPPNHSPPNHSRPNQSWADLMRRGLNTDSLERPERCGGRLRFMAHIEKPSVIRRILRHLGLPEEPVARAHPLLGCLDRPTEGGFRLVRRQQNPSRDADLSARLSSSTRLLALTALWRLQSDGPVRSVLTGNEV